MFEILKHFETKYGTLKKKGLRIEGLSMIDPKRKKHVIMISKPFIFDNRQLPKTYEGLDIKAKIEGGLPKEFLVKKYVDRCTEEIRKQFGNPLMSRQEMLDALAFGNFEEHKRKSIQMMKDGKIPPFKLN